MKKITLLTSSDLDGYTHDDHLLVSELEQLGFIVKSKAWETLKDDGEDLFVIRTTWNYSDHFEKFINCLESIKDRLWNPLPLIKWNSNKKYLLDLYKQGIDVMPLYLADSSKSLTSCLDQLGGDDFIAKPLVSASAKGLIRFTRSQPPELNKEMIIQKFHPEITQGEVSLIYFNGQLSHVVKKTPKAGDIRVQEEHGGTITAHIPTAEELQLAKDVLVKIPEKWLYARVDIVPGLGLIELECIEPSLYFGTHDQAAKRFALEISKFIL